MRCLKTNSIAALAVGLFAITVQADESQQSTWDGVFTAEQAQRGQVVYQTTCASCHGPQLNGIDAAPGLNGGGFYSNWNGVSLQVMSLRIKASMPQNAPNSLSRQQVADVMAYIFSRNGFPAGDRELSKRPAYLANIVFKPTAD
jgi:mono/diheme cytochrome c family protein